MIQDVPLKLTNSGLFGPKDQRATWSTGRWPGRLMGGGPKEPVKKLIQVANHSIKLLKVLSSWGFVCCFFISLLSFDKPEQKVSNLNVYLLYLLFDVCRCGTWFLGTVSSRALSFFLPCLVGKWHRLHFKGYLSWSPIVQKSFSGFDCFDTHWDKLNLVWKAARIQHGRYQGSKFRQHT